MKKERKKPEGAIEKKAPPRKAKTGRTIQGEAEHVLRLLILEDNPADAELMERQLQKDGIAFVALRVDTRAGFLQALKSFRPQLILADYTLPKFDALQALELVRKKPPFTPFIVVTGSIGEEKAVAVLRAGADDYLLKDRLARLGEAVQHARENRRLQMEKETAELTLKRSEEDFQDIFRTVKDGLAYADMQGNVLSVNPALVKIIRMPGKEIVGKNFLDLVRKHLSKESAKKTLPFLTELVRHGKSNGFQVEYQGRILDIQTSVNRKSRRMTGVVRDITERKRNEDALLAAAARWRTTFDSMNEAVCLLDEKGCAQQCNRAMNRLLGLPYKKIIGRDCLAMICGKRKKSSCSFQRLLKDGKRHEEETFWRGRWHHVTVDPIHAADGKAIGAVHIMSDVTAAREAAEKLGESEKKFRDLYENATIGLYRTTPGGRIIMANLALVRMLGYASFADLATRDLKKSGFEPEYPRRYFSELLRKNGQVRGLESAWSRRDGSVIHVRESAVTVKAPNGDILYYDGTVENISERKQAEKALREMSEIFRLFLKNNPIYVFIKDEEIRPIYLSDNYETMLGRPLGELLGKNMDELFPSALSRSMVEDDKGILRDGVAREFIEELQGRTYSTLKFPIFIDGKPKYLAGYTTDITDRRQAEKRLRLTSRRLELALDAAKAGTWDWDIVSGHIEWSPQMFALFGLDPLTSAASFAAWRSALHPDDVEMAGQRIEQALERHTNLDSDYRVRMPDGQLRWINAQGVGVYDAAGKPVQMIGICQDISERKSAEERTLASLREKEILLKEIHHRVKNNLQVISGLLSLQAAHIEDERLLRVIKESQSRIWTMALIHQTLYQSGNLASIDMGDYIRSLTGNLLSAHAQVAMPPTIFYNLEPLQLAIDKAIPLALIVNELATNAIKHAFPDGRAGEIRISLQEGRGVKFYAPTDENQSPIYELIVADDGIGLPAGFDAKNQKSLGLQLVSMLAGQLQGAMALEAGAGTSVRITFAPHEQHKKNG